MAERRFRRPDSHFGPDHPTFATSYSSLSLIQRDSGDLYQSEGDFATAESELAPARASVERAIVIMAMNYGPEHPHVAVVLNNLVTTDHAEVRKTSACKNLHRALKIATKHFQQNHPHVTGGRS